MDNLRIYALRNKDGILHPYFVTSTSDKEASKFIIGFLTKSINEVVNPQEKAIMLDDVRECSFVCIGYCDLVSNQLTNDFNVIFDLADFMKVKEDGEKEDGKKDL